MSVKLPEHERRYFCDRGQATLWEDDAADVEEARAYLLKTRNLSKGVLQKFNFGYVPRRVRHAWSERIIMPLYDPYGELVVLTSRKFRTTDQKQFPHLHEEFNKRFFMYGLNIAKKSILKKGKAIIVEGQIDTIHMHDEKFDVTVGILGSAFSPEHISILRRYCNEIYLMFDHDESGLKTLRRSILMVKEHDIDDTFGISVIPVVLPKGEQSKEDPDGFLTKNGRTGMLEVLRQAKLERKQFSIKDIDRRLEQYVIPKTTT